MKKIISKSFYFEAAHKLNITENEENKNVVLNTKKSIKYVLNNPKWKLSVQSHKFLKIK